ncbi:glycosyltransferase, partial [Neobacillus niacini]|uniref:glycosyltransferase n=1 Tax=Neobacillus niacini TaxID=86668 RepID=UPI002FFEC737
MNIQDNRKIKIILAHPGRQHSFQLATALKKGNILYKYITTVYDKDSSILMKITKIFLNKDNLKRANGRKCDSLRDSEVIKFCEIEGLFTIFLSRIDKAKRIYNWWMHYTADRFGKKVVHYAIKNNVDAVIMYDFNASRAFKLLKENAPHIKRIMDVSTPARNFQKDIFDEDGKKSGVFSSTLPQFAFNNSEMTRFISEIKDSDYFLTPSTFVNKSLSYNGKEIDKMINLPYGVDSTKFSYKNKSVNQTEPLTFLYAGQIAQHKGIYYLLEAFKRLNNKNLKLILIGNIHGVK